jgi:hypothetical protein
MLLSLKNKIIGTAFISNNEADEFVSCYRGGSGT